jgi:AmiR/NasT family two-component response regulator
MPPEGGIDLAATILIAVGNGVLADSLRFSLELEGFGVKLCDERSLRASTLEAYAADCLILDHDVFVRMVNGKGESRFARLGHPVILMVADKTEKVLARAKQAGVTTVVEQPLLGAVLLEAIKSALKERPPVARPRRPH